MSTGLETLSRLFDGIRTKINVFHMEAYKVNAAFSIQRQRMKEPWHDLCKEETCAKHGRNWINTTCSTDCIICRIILSIIQ